MQIKLLSDAPTRLQRKQSVYALHGPNAATELAMLCTVSGLDPASLPVMSALLKQPPASSLSSPAVSHAQQLASLQTHGEEMSRAADAACCPGTAMQTSAGQNIQDVPCIQPGQGMHAVGDIEPVDADVQKLAADFALNIEQIQVVQHCSQWAAGDKVRHAV